MTPFQQAAILTEALNAEGIRTTNDPSRIAPPCVLVTPPSLDADLNCGWTASWQTLLIVPAGNPRQSWELLDRMAATFVSIVEASHVSPTQFSTGEQPLPAYLIEHSSEVDWSIP
jgi:hypothetical protein